MAEIRIESVSKAFGDKTVLKGASLEVSSGSCFYLLGPSGCGKTTLLRIIAGFLKPDSGTVTVGGRDITHDPVNKRNMAMVFQNYALWPHLSVAENVAFGLKQQKVPKVERKERVQEALDRVKLGDYADRQPSQLSGGQQQRVALARALVVRPVCLLLDEPLSNLDAGLRAEMRDDIRSLCKTFGLTAITVTHDQAEALAAGDQIVLLNNGVIEQAGAPVDLYRRPASGFAARFLGETNLLSGKVVDSIGSELMVDSSIGLLKGVSCLTEASAIKKGDQVEVSIRPECITESMFPSEENGFSGKRESQIYLGSALSACVRVGKETLKVNSSNPRNLNVDKDKEVHFTVDPDDVVVIPASGK